MRKDAERSVDVPSGAAAVKRRTQEFGKETTVYMSNQTERERYGDQSLTMGERAKNKIFGVIYGRTAVVLLLLLLQIGIMVFTLTFLENYASYLYGVFVILSMAAVIYIINEKESNPAFKMTWLLLVLLVPVVGVGFYIYVKMDFGTRYMGKRLQVLRHETEPFMQQNENVVKAMRSSRLANTNLSHFLCHQVGFPTYSNTTAQYFPLGDDKFPVLVEELKKAEKYIFMEYFIVQEGIMWDTVLAILEEKAAEGVEVRFMYDGTCSVSQLPYEYPEELKAKGIRCKVFAPVRPIMTTTQNNRDHRKICVIDGKVAFTGGVNLADEYINKKVRFGHWKDTAIMLKGDAVQSFTMMFLQLWNIDEKEPELYRSYLTRKHRNFSRETGYMIPYGDSPYDHENVGEEVYIHILNHAKRYVHIMTPYLILDNEMMTALKRAAKSGIEVQIIMPHIPDKPYAFYLAKTYYAELIESGVQIFEYLPGFVHAKVFTSDDDTATVGTVNLDFRSLYLHFECGVFIYHNPVVYDIEQDFQKTLAVSQKVTLTDVKNRSLLIQIYGQLLRLIAPLM